MIKEPLGRREFLAGSVAFGAVAAGTFPVPPSAASSVKEETMATATIDGLEVSYVVKGSGPALLMLAPGGFDATMEKWTTAGVWKGMRPLDTLTSDFTLIAYDRRESGASGGRVE